MSIYDKASLVLIPSGTKTSKVYSQKPVNGDGDFTFSRSTAATRVNADGVIEKETQNLLTYSNTFSSWSPTRGTLVQGVADPFGGNNAWSLTATDADPYLYNQTAWSGVVTLSIYAKGVGSSIGKPIQLRMGGNFREFTLTGDWQRFEHFTNGSAANIGIEVPNPAVAGDVVHLYGAQLEYGLVARDYIETTTSAVEGGITDNVPRLDYTDASCPSLLLEPQRSNVVPNSEYHSGTTYGNSNLTTTDNQAISPEGVQNAAKIVLDSGTNTSNGGHYFSFSSTAGTTYTISVFAKAGEYRYFTFTYGSVSAVGGHFDLQEGVKLGDITNAQYTNTSASIEPYGNGWYRLVVTLTDTSSVSARFISMKPSPSASVPSNNSYSSTGDGTSGAYIYGFQLEAGSYATSYIPTYGSAVTRNADTYYNNNMASLYDSANGFCLYFEYADVKRGDTAFFDYFSFQQLPNTDTGFRAESAGANNLEWRIYTDNIDSDLGFPMRVSNIESKRKVLMKVETTGIKLFADGSLEDSQSGYVVIPTLGTLQPSRSTAQPSVTQIKQSLGQILYLPVLTDEECIDLTTL